MERKSAIRIALYENLRTLMTRHLFEKITIKQICDETGVIRATFYNHFDDKYDCLNAIVNHDIVETAGSLGKDSTKEILTRLFAMLDEEHTFYVAAYQVTGQNSFDEMVIDNFQILFRDYFSKWRDPSYLPAYSNEILAGYYANCMAYMVRTFVQKRVPYSAAEMVEASYAFMTSSFLDFLGRN